jgi:hypothetical protein
MEYGCICSIRWWWRPKRLTWHPGVDMVTGWSNDGMKVVFTWSQKCTLSRFRSIMGNFYWRGNPSPLIYLELQTANSPRRIAVCIWTDFSLGAWVQNYRGGQNNPPHFWFKTFTTQKLPWENSRDIDPVWMDNNTFFLIAILVWISGRMISQQNSSENFLQRIWLQEPAITKHLFSKRRLPLYISSWFK